MYINTLNAGLRSEENLKSRFEKCLRIYLFASSIIAALIGSNVLLGPLNEILAGSEVSMFNQS